MPTINCQNKKFLNIEAIIFDKDGTLEDSASFLRELGIKIVQLIEAEIPGISPSLLLSLGIRDDSLDPTGLMAVGSRLENEIASAAYIAERGKGWFTARKIAQKAFNQADILQKDAQSSSIFPGCLEVIKSLHLAGLKLAILSLDSTANIGSFIERHQLSDFIALYQGADQRYSKPDPACFREVCQKLGVACKNTLMVGDSQIDISMAKNAGAAGVIGICWTDALSKSLEGADVKIAHIQTISIS